MPLAVSDARTRRYVVWVRSHVGAIFVASTLVVAASIFLISRYLPLYADFSYLLPQDAPAVRDLRRIEGRVKTSDTVLVVIRSARPDVVSAATAEMLGRARELPPTLVARVDGDDADARAFFRAHRHLLVSLADLERARDALRKRINAAKLAANPLYVDLDDSGSDAKANRDELDELRKKRRDVERKLDRPSNISEDGRAALLQVRTAFVGTDVGRGKELLAALDDAKARVVAAHPGVEIGLAGGVVASIAEHDALVNGTVLSSIVTTLLVALVLALYFRSATLLILLVTLVSRDCGRVWRRGLHRRTSQRGDRVLGDRSSPATASTTASY